MLQLLTLLRSSCNAKKKWYSMNITIWAFFCKLQVSERERFDIAIRITKLCEISHIICHFLYSHAS